MIFKNDRNVNNTTKERLDYPTRVKIERTVISHLKKVTKERVPEHETSLRRKAVWSARRPTLP